MGVKQRVDLTEGQVRAILAQMAPEEREPWLREYLGQSQPRGRVVPKKPSTMDIVGQGAKGIATDYAKKEAFNAVKEQFFPKAAEATTGAANAATAAQTPGMLETAGTYLGPIMGAYGAYNLAKKQGDTPRGKGWKSGAIQGAASGAAIGGVPGAIIGGLTGAIGPLFGSRKGYDQMQRDSIRKYLQQGGAVDKDWNLNFSDQSKFNIGRDGGARLRNAAGQERQVFDVDFSDPRAADTVAATDALSTLITGGKKEQKEWMSGYYANAALNEAKDQAVIDQRLRDLFASHKVGSEAGKARLGELLRSGAIDQQKMDVFSNILNKYAGAAQPPARKDSKPQPVARPIAGNMEQLIGGFSRLPQPVARPIAGQIQSGVLRRDPNLPVVNIEDMVRQVPEETKNRLRRAKYLRK